MLILCVVYITIVSVSIFLLSTQINPHYRRLDPLSGRVLIRPSTIITVSLMLVFMIISLVLLPWKLVVSNIFDLCRISFTIYLLRRFFLLHHTCISAIVWVNVRQLYLLSGIRKFPVLDHLLLLIVLLLLLKLDVDYRKLVFVDRWVEGS